MAGEPLPAAEAAAEKLLMADVTLAGLQYALTIVNTTTFYTYLTRYSTVSNHKKSW